MIAVLIDSCKVGASGRVAVRDATLLRLSGLDGDVVRILGFNAKGRIEDLTVVSENCTLALGPQVTYISVEHMECGKGRVFADLVR